MPGFFVSSDRCETNLYNLFPQRCVSETLPLPDGTARRNTLRSFMEDKAFFADEKGAVIGEGILLNKAELFREYGCDTVSGLLRRMYAELGESFVLKLCGSFSCVLYIRAEGLWLVYTNPIGDATVYYALSGKDFYAGSQVNYVLDACREKGVSLSPDAQAAYEMLTFGYMESDRTYAREVRRLRGGTYLRVSRGKAEVREYHRFEKHPERFAGKSEAEIVQAMDEAFRRAVEREYAKDEEYGARHFAEISGGMDARMSMWTAHTMKPRHIQLLTYGMSGYLDERYSKQIAAYWQDELFIKPLNDGSFFFDIDTNTFMLGGLSSYEAITGGRRALEALDFSRFGLDHTGQIGDAVIGCFCKSAEEMRRNLPRKRASERLSTRLEKNGYHDSFSDHELYLLYTRAFQGACSTHQLRRNFAEPVSPFMDTDFLQLCLDIPMEMRTNRKLYNRWVIGCYPAAAEIPWEGTGGKITDNRVQKLWHRLKKRGPDKLLELLGMRDKARFSMNPLDYLSRRGTKQREYMDAYEKRAYDNLPIGLPDTLQSDLRELYATGSAEERCLVLTVLSAFGQYFHPAGKER